MKLRMKKIDLHTHTQKCKRGDRNARNIDAASYVDKMQNNNIGVCAITNHNKFDKGEYNWIINNAPDLVIFPGIELDVIFSNNRVKHVILICDPKCRIKFYDIFSNEPDRDYDTYKLNYNAFLNKVNKFKKNEIIIIPHFLDKDKQRALSISDKDKLKTDLQQYVIILETSKLKSMGIVNAHDEMALIGSDVQDWKYYEQEAKLLPELKFSINSFGKFYELASEPKLFIKSALNGCERYKINLCSTKEEVIEIYEDINIIFGEKGSGKTVLLKEYVYPELQRLGKKTFLHEGKDYQISYDTMLEDIKLSIDIDEELKEDSIKRIDKLFKYKEIIIENVIDKYLKYYEDETKNKNAKNIKKTEAIYNENSTDNILEIIQDTNNKIDKINNIFDINNEFREDRNPHKELLSSELNILKKELIKSAITKCRYKFVIDKVNIFLKGLKQTLDKKTGKKSKPNNMGFSELVANRKKYIELNKNIINNLKYLNRSKIIKLGDLPVKGSVNVEVSIKVLGKDEKHIKGSPFDKNKIKANRDFIRKLYSFSAANFLNINEYFANEEREGSPREYFGECVKKSCRVIRENGETYEPSPGEKSILSISGVIENNAYDCYLFDEIERGLGNKYIADYIIPRVKLLRDRGKLIVISTHDANIAINTLPSQTIYCNYTGNVESEIYYQGNMYSNELKSIKDNNNIINWDEKALKHLEGGKHMFSTRSNIWSLKE